ncbi:cytochrome c biogenesis CcdA family protein [Paeniglutamicibacter sulfureus]|uniref:Cytochrome C biogenesis protein transmembrane domain-containing protein n=1 Tax=Paeniglutamicibacter sulfureus TaxID=43666 RepID=A0ABU2BHA4_9MICC|nr:cytochrome c biogenesis protein CcdA [Paeniglutamicibacter sulfureus]MDR7358036.1 hypothetical protein [Paeniglutamicibacter sulfureus]
MLGVFSPCNALLLPAFFANIATSRATLLSLGSVFRAACLPPWSLSDWVWDGWAEPSSSTAASCSAEPNGLIAPGLFTAFRGGIDLSRLVPGRPRPVAGSLAGTFALGAVSGVAGFCTGPVVGAILTLALSSASPARGGTLLGLYGVGMVLPIMFIALLVRKLGHRSVSSRAAIPCGQVAPAHDLVDDGRFTVLVGWILIFTNGTAAVPELLPSNWNAAFENLGRQVDAAVPSWAWTALVGACC